MLPESAAQVNDATPVFEVMLFLLLVCNGTAISNSHFDQAQWAGDSAHSALLRGAS
jgi:hypothetical protein